MSEIVLNPSAGVTKTLGNLETSKSDAIAKAAAVQELTKADVPQVVEQAPKTEQSPTDTKSAAPSDERFQQLVRKERAVLEQQRAVRAQAERMRTELAEIEQAKVFMKNAKANPLKALEQLGVTYNDLTQAVLNDGKPAADLQVRELKEEMQRYQANQQREMAKQRELQRQSIIREQQAAIQEFNEEVADFVKTNADNYELTNLHNGHALVAQTIEQYFKQTGKVMSPKEAADQVESYLEQAVEKSIATKKWKQRSNPKEEKTAVSGQQSRTLTNEMTASTPSMMNAAKTEKERLQRALAALDANTR